MSRSLRFLFLAALLVCFALPSQATNILINNGFETGDFGGWTLTVPDFNCVVLGTGGDIPGCSDPNAPNPQTNSLYVYEGNYGTFLGGGGTLYQIVNLDPGTQYTFAFQWRHHLSYDGTPQTSSLGYIFGSGDPLAATATLIPGGTDLQGTTDWVLESFNVSSVAGGAYFVGFQFNDVFGEFAIDNACLVEDGQTCTFDAPAEIPEPSTMALIAIPLAALGLFRRKRA